MFILNVSVNTIVAMIRFMLISFFLVCGQCFLVKDSSELEKHRHDDQQSRGSDAPSRQPLILTPLIEAGKILEGQKAAKVVGILENVESYAGYFTVNQTHSRNLFFWYFPAEERPDSPVLLWLQGGPGGSSMFGLANENGPIQVDTNGSAHLRHLRWTKNHHVIYIDSPAGVGFSFPEPDIPFGEELISADLYTALEQFFRLFPHLADNDFYVAGESYAGRYVPSVGYAIHQRNLEGNVKINLRGMMIGNGIILKNCHFEKNYIQHYLTQNGLVGDWSGIDPYNYLEDGYGLDCDGMTSFFNRADTQYHIHVGVVNYQPLNYHINVIVRMADHNFNVVPLVEELLEHYSILYYYGQVDTACPYPPSEAELYQLRWSGSPDFSQATRQHWYVDGNLAGYIKSGGNLSLALVRDAGHMVPKDQPIWAIDLIRRFINKELPL